MMSKNVIATNIPEFGPGYAVTESPIPLLRPSDNCLEKRGVILSALAIITIIPIIFLALREFFRALTWYLLMPQLHQTQETEKAWKILKSRSPEAERVTLQTPDLAILDGVLIPGHTHPKKFIIYTIERNHSWEKKAGKEKENHTISMLRKTGASILIMNPRGVGKSKLPQEDAIPAPSPEELALDVYASFLFLRDIKGADLESDILLYGRSLGGAFGLMGSAMVQTSPHGNNKKISAMIERSFSSYDSEVQCLMHHHLPHGLKGLSAIPGWFIHSFNLNNLNGTKAMQLLQGRRVVIYHPKDNWIPHESSLFHDISQRDIVVPIEVIELEDNKKSKESAHTHKFTGPDRCHVRHTIQDILGIPLQRAKPIKKKAV